MNMVETSGTKMSGAPVAEEPSGFKVLKEYFRSQFLKLFEQISS